MAKNFLQGVKLKSQGQRNGFDVSYQNQFTAPFGMLLPCFFQRVNPDDKIKLSNETQTICDGLVKPAFMRLREHIDYYFIPATQLWMPFDEFITGQNSYFSSAVDGINNHSVPSQVPTFTLKYLQAILEHMDQTNKRDDLGYFLSVGAVRLLDHLGYCNLTKLALKQFQDFSKLGWANDLTRLNLFPLMCYQKVYYDFYRNAKYEDNVVGAYNIDDLASGFTASDLADLDFDRACNIFKIHYRWQKKDYFTQTQPNILPMNGDIGYDSLQSTINLNNLLNLPGMLSSQPHVDENGFTKNSGEFVATGGTSKSGTVTAATIKDTAVSVANIRFAFAYDRLLRRMREAGPDFDSQMLAQFGISPFDARHGKARYIGGYTNGLSSADVTNMTGSGIGELAGQINAYGDNSSKVLNFHAKEHGYIIGIYSTSVDNMYQSYRMSREVLLKERFDWFNSAFENIGLAPIFACERDYTVVGDAIADRGESWDTNSTQNVIGYVPRYSELKTHVDECHGVLCEYTQQTGFREWNVQTNTQNYDGQYLLRNNLLLNPAQFDQVAGIEYNGFPNTDHFVVNQYHHSKKVSSMSMFEDF